MTLLRSLLAASVLVALAGCGNVCDRMCDAQADMLERCFPEWEMSWEDLSYDGRDHFIDRCYVVQGEGLDQLDQDDPGRQETERCCERNLQTARSDIDCESLLSLDCVTD